MANRMLEMAIAIKGKIDGSLSSSVSAAVSQTKNLTKQISATNKEIKELQSNYAKATGFKKMSLQADLLQQEKAVNDVITKRADLYAKVDAKRDAQSKFDKTRGHLKTAVVGTAIAAAPLALAVKEAMNYESAMADVRKVVDFDEPDGLVKMKGDILEMSQRLPMSAEGIAKIVAAGGQAGIAAKDLAQFAESAVKMGIAFDVSADEAGQMMAQWRTAFGMNQGQVNTLADQINYLGNTTAVSTGPISDIVTRIGPLASTAGLSASEVAALGASIASTGTPSEIAATGIKNMMLAMTAGESATKDQQKAFESLGISTTDLAERMQTDAQGAIIGLLERIKELPAAEQAATMAELFGKESVGAIAPLLTQLDNLKTNFHAVGDASLYAGSMEKEYEARAATTENQIQLTKNSIAALAVNVGSVLLPAVNDALKAASSAASSFAHWAGEHPALVQGLISVTAAVTALILACLTIQTIRSGVNLVVSSFRLMKTVIDAAKVSQLAMNAAALANPYVLIAVVIIALVGALIYLWNTNDGFRNAIINAWKAIKAGVLAAIAGVVSFIKSGFTLLGTILTGFINFLLNLPQNIAFAIGFIIGVITQLPALVGTAITAAIAFIVTLPSSIYNAGVAFLAFLSDWLDSAYLTTVSLLSQLVQGAYKFLLQLPSYCAEAGAEFVAAAEAWASEAYNSVINWISQIPGKIRDLISGAWDGIKAQFSSGFNVGVNVAGNAKPYANGGIVNSAQLALLGEAGYPEVVVPIDGSRNAESLWRTAGQMLGVKRSLAPVMSGPTAPHIASSSGGTGFGSASFVFSPQIIVQGDANPDDIMAALDFKMREFESMIARHTANQRRLSYD